MDNPPPREWVEKIDLVEHELERNVVGPDVDEHRVHGVDRLAKPVLGQRCVGDVQDEVGDERFLERCREALDQLSRKSSDEADRVRDEKLLPVVLERARRRVERLEEAIVDRCTGSRQGVQKRRLADVRVPGERDRRDARPPSLLSARCSLAAERT